MISSSGAQLPGQILITTWDGVDLPFLDIKNANVLESPAGIWTHEWLGLGHCSAVVLVEVRVLLHLQAVQNALCQDVIRRRLVGTIVESRPAVLRGGTEEMARLVEDIKGQVKQLCVAIDKYHPHFWPSLFNNPATAIAVEPLPLRYSSHTQNEAGSLDAILALTTSASSQST